MDYIKIDIVRLETEVRAKAKEYLEIVSEESLRNFAESTKIIAESVLEDYFFKVDDFYTEGPYKIEDNEKLQQFSDFYNGYRQQMKDWIKNHKIQIREMKLSDWEQSNNNSQERDSKTILIKGAGIGTLIAVGLFIFTNIWVALAAEILALGMTYYIYKKDKEKEQFQAKQYEIRLENKKAELIDGVIADLKKWLKEAETASDSFIEQYK